MHLAHGDQPYAWHGVGQEDDAERMSVKRRHSIPWKDTVGSVGHGELFRKRTAAMKTNPRLKCSIRRCLVRGFSVKFFGTNPWNFRVILGEGCPICQLFFFQGTKNLTENQKITYTYLEEKA